MRTMPSPTRMYRAVLERDSQFDGVFLVAVKTTGVFCRPTCASRKPRRENVEFFASAGEALHAGYRPCKRCRPMDRAQPPEWVQALMARIDRAPSRRMTEGDLRAMKIDPARARRYFSRHYGMTFHAYHRARRLGLALGEIRNGNGSASVAAKHGFASSSGFRDAFARVFGSPPERARDQACLVARWLDTPLGPMLAVADDGSLHVLEFVDRRALERELRVLRDRLGAAIVPGDNRVLRKTADELSRYFEGTLTRFTVPLARDGSPFQRRVWERLCAIPHGTTKSYAQIAAEVGSPGAHRAVGRANGDNRIAIIIPCHRVVRADGSLCGYGGGVWRKQWLLEHERSHR